MELGLWEEVAVTTLLAFVEAISRVEDGADFRMVEILSMLLRWGDHPQFPAPLKQALENCALGLRYWSDEPGSTSANYHTENHELAWNSSELFAGQLWPDRVFINNGQDGKWHRAHGEQLALRWLQRRGRYGFEEWDANGYLAADVNLLANLYELSDSPTLKRLSRALLDKIHFIFASNSFQGCFGSSHGRTAVAYIKDARNEPVACLAYLGWGLTALNDEHVDEVVNTIGAKYAPPEIIRAIALDQPEAFWSRERSGLDPVRLQQGQGPVDKVTFKTPDFMLCSAQNWKAGGGGYQQHIWQATLGPDAPVFVTAPACISEDGNRRPNFWMGNQTLPSVAQWQDTLISVHKLNNDDWLDFTHAWFPTFAFDEYVIQGGWAFARKRNGYLALTAAQGLSLMTRGDSAQRELRSTGRNNVWLCQMGRAAQDGDFAAFQRQVLALPVKFGALSANLTALRGETLEFGWDGPLRVNGAETPITGFKHFENPYCTADWPTDRMVIAHQGRELTLDFR